MTDGADRTEDEQALRTGGIGCATLLAGFNVVAMGLVVATFAVGPYSSASQEVWYRYGSIAFFCAGAILPGIVLTFFRRRSLVILKAVAIWEFAVLLAFMSYLFMSGGGI
jgi:hypothetical protein